MKTNIRMRTIWCAENDCTPCKYKVPATQSLDGPIYALNQRGQAVILPAGSTHKTKADCLVSLIRKKKTEKARWLALAELADDVIRALECELIKTERK